MNFTQVIRRELLSRRPTERCCLLATINALLTTSGTYSAAETGGFFEFTSEDEGVSEDFFAAAEAAFGVRVTLKGVVRDSRRGRDKVTFAYGGADAGAIAAEIGRHGAEAVRRGGRDCCARAYLRGAFLGSGSCTLPRGGAKTGYHLEFVFSGARDAEAFRELIDGMQLVGGAVPRGEKTVVYFKSREAIADFLSVLGADGALAKLEAVSAEREESNNENRVSNCFAGNADRTAIASAAQIVALGELGRRGVLASLPEPLRRTADARVAHPTLSLAELAALLGVTKSCLNHRLRKLTALCRSTEEGS